MTSAARIVFKGFAQPKKLKFYTPDEFAVLLENADVSMRPIIAIGGLAGLSTAELLRLDWADVWQVPGHIGVTKSKPRPRRLVEIRPALAAWLEPYRAHTTGKLWKLDEITFQQKFVALCEAAKVKRKTNGLRNAFCTYHFALQANLATKDEAQKWFAVLPLNPPRM
jgi:integrase